MRFRSAFFPLIAIVVLTVVLAGQRLSAAIQESYDLNANWISPDSWGNISAGQYSNGHIYLYVLDGQGNAVTPFSGIVQSLSIGVSYGHFWDSGSIGGVGATQHHHPDEYNTWYHTNDSICTIPSDGGPWPVAGNLITYTTTPIEAPFKSSYSGDPGLPQIPVYVVSTGGFNYSNYYFPETSWHKDKLEFETNIHWTATVVASSIVLNTAARTLQVGWYHEFLSKTAGNNFPDSYAMGAARILSQQTNPDGSSILHFVSDNPAVCTVDAKGHVQAVGLGTCHITVTCDSAPAQIATFTVTGPPTIRGGVVLVDKNGTTIDLTSRVTASGSIPTTLNLGGVTSSAAVTWTNSSHAIAWPNAGWGAVSIVPTAGYHAGSFTVSVTDNNGQTGTAQTIMWGVAKDPLGPGGNPWLPDSIAMLLPTEGAVGRLASTGQMPGQPLLPSADGGGGGGGGSNGPHPPDATPTTDDPVRYANGEMQMYEDDLDLGQVPGAMSLRRSYSNLSLVPGGQLGISWNLDAQPSIARAPSSSCVVVTVRADLQVSFTDNGNNTYTAIRGNPATLVAINGNAELVYTDVNGVRIDFYGFAASPAPLQGKAKNVFTPGGNRLAYAYDAGGLLSTITRIVSSSESDVIAFTNDFQGRAASISRKHIVGSQSTVVRQVQYQYYAGIAGDYGDNGTLRCVQVSDGQGRLLRQFYYRYYRAGDATGSLGQIKYAVGPRHCEQMFKATGQDAFAVTMPDAQLAGYADKAFQYDNASGRVLQQVLQTPDLNGSGTYGYAYVPRTVATPGPNDWLMRTTETLPDGAQNVVYTNQQGQVLLKAAKASASATQLWIDAYRYDANWHMIWHITPAAMQQSGGAWYSESFTDLLGYVQNGTSAYVKTGSGLIEVIAYYPTTDGAGAVAGYPQYLQRMDGQDGTAVNGRLTMVKKFTYTAHTAP